jgi:hypothetical protein
MCANMHEHAQKNICVKGLVVEKIGYLQMNLLVPGLPDGE